MGKKIPMWQTLLVMLAMIGLLMWSIIKDTGGEPHIALVLAASFAGIIAVLNGWKWAYLEQGILASINRSMQAILILAILGAIIASWMAAGTIPSMMYYGIKIISPKVFLVTGCILCSIVSLATGSSWSTAGSIGVALMGVGTALGFPPAMTAGAVVSGAYFGDKMSPLSDTTNLAPAMAGATLFGHIKHMVYTTGTSLIIALVAYAVMGFMHASSNEPDMSVMQEILDFIAASSNISLLTLIPPLFVIIAVAMKLPAIPSLVGGALLAMFQTTVQASAFMSAMTYEILLIVVIGGIGSVSGSCIAAFLYIACSEWWLRFLDSGKLPFGNIDVPFFRDGFRKVVFSVVIMIIVLFFSKGIMGNKELSFVGLIRKIKARKAAKAAKTEEGGAA